LWDLLVAFAAAWEQRQFIGLFLIYTNEGSRQSKKFIGLLFIYASLSSLNRGLSQ
jgi:hypothetical protein